MRYLVGIDNGGTFSKAAVFDEDGRQMAVASEPTVTITPKPGYTERDMNELWEVNAKKLCAGQLPRAGLIQKRLQGSLSPDTVRDFTWWDMMGSQATMVSSPQMPGPGSMWRSGMGTGQTKRCLRSPASRF